MIPSKRLFAAILLVAVLCFTAPQPAFAATLTLQPAADTTLIEVAPENNLGGADFFNAGTAGNGQRNRALLLYDLSAIPPGSIITSGFLSMEIVRQPLMDQQNGLFSLRRMFSSWGEGVQIPADPLSPGLAAPAEPGEATWLHRFHGSVPWAAPGGLQGVDYSAQISSTAYVYGIGDPVQFETTPEMIADLQFWLDNPASNFGWMMRAEDERVRKNARSYASHESAFGPMLVIEFTPVPEPSMLALLALAAGSAIFLRRRRRAS